MKAISFQDTMVTNLQGWEFLITFLKLVESYGMLVYFLLIAICHQTKQSVYKCQRYCFIVAFAFNKIEKLYIKCILVKSLYSK